MPTAAAPRLIPKHELRKIKQQVSKLRKKGHEVWTDEEVEKAGWTTEQSMQSGLLVSQQQQQESWDCGLACVQMVLGALGVMPTQAALTKRIASSSVWTIDLAYLLTEFGVKCELLTATACMDMSTYNGNRFYDEASLSADARRVAQLLHSAATEGVAVTQKTLSATELWNMMREEDTMVIALVDAAILHTRVSVNVKASSATHDFQGHYVLLLGLDDDRGGFYINDPARKDERTFVHAASLEAARLADGTDQDLILCPVYQQPPDLLLSETSPKILRVVGAAVDY